MSALIARHTIDSPDGVTLSVQEWGNPAGPAILFIHGISQATSPGANNMKAI